MSKRRSVGVRELRQNLSKYLRRVAAGESLQVTGRGRPVALLTPLPGQGGPIERLIAAGAARPARLDLTRLGLPRGARTTMSISRALLEQRAER